MKLSEPSESSKISTVCTVYVNLLNAIVAHWQIYGSVGRCRRAVCLEILRTLFRRVCYSIGHRLKTRIVQAVTFSRLGASHQSCVAVHSSRSHLINFRSRTQTSPLYQCCRIATITEVVLGVLSAIYVLVNIYSL